MKQNFILMGLFLLILGGPLARGQGIWPSTLNATGGSIYIAGNEYEWSVGEMALVNTFTTSSIIVTQGVLQTKFGPGYTEVPTTTNLDDYLQVYPNPANGIINVTYNSNKAGVLSLRIMDMAGKIVSQQKADVKQGQSIHKVDVAALAAATYMLEVYMAPTNGKEESISYKIQKLQ
jgi:hypothetical protein